MQSVRLRFIQRIGRLAKIEGIAEAADGAINLELAMTESIKGPVKGVLKRSIPYSELEDVQYSRRFLQPPDLRFTAATLEAFQSIPGASGFEYAVIPVGKKSECRSFVTDVQLAIAEAAMERFTKQIAETEDDNT